MILARQGLFGVLWQHQHGTSEELAVALEYLQAKYELTGKVFAREASKGIEAADSLPSGYWLMELKAKPPPE